jgi:tetratricopeptide (TPR) repeat protein
MRLLYRCCLIALLLSGYVSAQPDFNSLVQAVEKGQDGQAVRIAQELQDKGEGSFGVFYNQGLAYRNQGQTARARASFERALLYSPRDLATRRRLREVKERLSPEIAQHDVTPTPWWTRSESRIVLLLSALAVLGLGLARAGKKGISSRQLLSGSILFLLLVAIVVLTNPPSSRGVIVSSTARLLSKAEGGASGPIVLEGVLVEVLDKKGHFVEVGTREGTRGWVRSAEIEII